MIENSCEEEDSDPESEEDAIGHDRVLYDHQQLQPDGSTGN